MRLFRSLLALAAVVSLALPAWAEDVPPGLKAKREGSARLSAPAAIPSPLSMIYTPIAPCRSGRADIAAGRAVAFQIAGNCGVPAYAKAVSATLSAVPIGTGFLTAYPTGQTRPNIASLNYRAGVTNTSGVITPISATGAMDIYATAAAKVYVDITGYYEPQLWAYVSRGGGLIDSSGRVTSVSKGGAGEYVVYFDRSIASCVGVASSDLAARTIAVYTDGNYASVYVTENGVYSDYYFNLHIMC